VKDTLLNSTLILVIGFFTISCSNKIHNKQAIEINVDEIISEKPLVFSEVFSDFRVIPLETNEYCIINNLDNIKIVRDTIYIFDRNAKSVFIFSNNGRLISKISRIGRGPGEFNQPFDFDVDKNGILIFDNSTKKLNKYDLKGNFLSSMNFEYRFSSFVKADDNIYGYKSFPPGNGTEQDDYLLYLFDKENLNTWKTLKYSTILHGPKVIEFIEGGNFFKTESGLKFFMNYCNTIFSIRNKTIKPYIILDSQKHKLKKDDLKNYTLDEPMSFMKANPDKLSKISGYSENDSMAFIKFRIGISEYYTFMHFRTRKIICCARYNDDLTYIYPNLFQIHNNQLIAYVHPRRVSAFKELILSGKVKVEDDVRSQMLKAADFDNPVLILYDLKEN
jgi:hypothetical protein